MEEVKGRRRVKKMGKGIELAEDVVENILVRLQVKSLMRFKCVDRSWDVMFKTPTFVNNHMQSHRNEEIIMFSHKRHISEVLLFKDSVSVVDTKNLFPEFNSEGLYDNENIFLFRIQGHCKGVFCMCVHLDHEIIPGEGRYHKLILWNPATREVKVVPPPPMPSHSGSYISLFGFGIDPNSCDFKVVNTIIYKYQQHPPYVVLYNLITNSWTLITIDPIIVDALIKVKYELNGYFAKGVCYWILGVDNNGIILCFDFHNNQFRILKCPPTPTALRPSFRCDIITEDKDSTTYVAHYMGTSNNRNYWKIEIWILEEDRWTKKHTYPHFKNPVALLAIWKDGAEFIGVSIIIESIQMMYFQSFNSNSITVRDFDLPKLSTDAHKYIESITSLSL